MSRATPAFRILAAALLFALVAITPALAAQPALFTGVVVQMEEHAAENSSVLVISGILPDTQTLPATVRIAIPQGPTLMWSGEVLGGPLSEDPSVEPRFTHGENGFDTAELDLTRGRVGQIELNAGQLVESLGETRRATIPWYAVDAVPEVRLAFLVPPGSQIVTFSPGAIVEPGPNNGTIVALDASATAGQNFELVVEYTTPPAPTVAGGAAGSSGGQSMATLLVIAVVLVGFTLFGLSVVNRNKARAAARSAEETPRSADDDADDADVSDDAAASLDQNGAPTPPVAQAAAPAPKRMTPQVIIFGVVIAVLLVVIAIVALGEAPGTTQTTDEFVYKVFTSASGAGVVSYQLTMSEGDPAHESTHVFEALATNPAIRSGKLFLATGTIEVKYDPAQIDANGVAGVLAAGGYPPASGQ